MRIPGAVSFTIATTSASGAQHAEAGPVGEQVEEGEEHRSLFGRCVSLYRNEHMQSADERSKHRLLHSEQSVLRPFTAKFPQPASSFEVFSQASVGTPGINGEIKDANDSSSCAQISHE
jgi:hypothetical protein